MKAWFNAFVITLVVLGGPVAARAEKLVNVTFGGLVGLAYAPDQKGFSASGGNISDSFHIVPELFLGLDFRTPASGVGCDLFGGVISHGGFTGSFAGAEVSYILPHADKAKFLQRLKVGAFWANLDWADSGVDNVTFKDTTGFQGGYAFDVGRTVAFHGEILYRQMAFDLEPGATFPSADKLDLSGVVVNFGVRFNFPVGSEPSGK